MGRAPCCQKVGLKKGKWAKEEDEILANYIKIHGEGSWKSLPKNAGLLRCGKSCRLRWINYLQSGLKKGNFSKEEEDLIIKLRANLGNKWSKIASKLPGRTDNDIKNYWNSHLSRSIHCYHQLNQRNKNSEAESSEPSKSSHKNKTERNTEKIAQGTRKRRQRKIVDKVLQPQNLTKHCDQKVQSELLSMSDADAINGPLISPTNFDNSSFSFNTDVSSTSKEEITNWPSSPDLSTLFKEMDELLSCEIKATNVVQDTSSILGDMEDGNLLVQLETRMLEEESGFGDWGWMDSLWDLDLWSSVSF